MKPFQNRHMPLAQSGPGADTRQAIVILAVGDLDEWERQGEPMPADRCVAFAPIEAVTSEFIELISPGLVLSPLLARGFDCADLAQALYRAGYRGRYRALSPPLPDPAMISREIVALCPGLDFDVVILDPGLSPLH